MAKPFNPLFDTRPVRGHTVSAGLLDERAFPAVANKDAPKSPITGRPMVQALCGDGDIPVFVDLDSRVVLPVKS